MVGDEAREAVGDAEGADPEIGVDEGSGSQRRHAREVGREGAEVGTQHRRLRVVERGQEEVAAVPCQVGGDEETGAVQGGDPPSYLEDVGDRQQPAHQAQHGRVDLGRGVVPATRTVDPDHRTLATGLGEERLAGPAAGQRRQLGEIHAPTVPHAPARG